MCLAGEKGERTADDWWKGVHGWLIRFLEFTFIVSCAGLFIILDMVDLPREPTHQRNQQAESKT